eukprot:2316195-Rhodomonas_salina.1
MHARRDVNTGSSMWVADMAQQRRGALPDGEASAVAPHRRVRARPDVRVDAHDLAATHAASASAVAQVHQSRSAQLPALAISLHLSANSCQIPNDDEGPPTLVLSLPVIRCIRSGHRRAGTHADSGPPDPTPGLKRRPSSLPGHLATNFSSWSTEQ